MALSKDKLKELEYLRNRSICIIDFMLKENSGDPMLTQYRQIIENAYNEINLRGMKILSRDINAWAKGLPQKQIKELEVLLASKFAEDLSGDKTTHETIRQLLKKGKVSNEEEYRIVHEYLQDISKGDTFFDNLFELEVLLRTYKV